MSSSNTPAAGAGGIVQVQVQWKNGWDSDNAWVDELKYKRLRTGNDDRRSLVLHRVGKYPGSDFQGSNAQTQGVREVKQSAI